MIAMGRGKMKVTIIHADEGFRNSYLPTKRFTTQRELLEELLNHEDTGQIYSIINKTNNDIWVVYEDMHEFNEYQKKELEKQQ